MIENKAQNTTSKNFIQELDLFQKKIKLTLTFNDKNVISLWMEYEDNIIYSTLVINDKCEGKNTHLTVYYKEQIYAHNRYFNNKRDGGKTEKEILMSRTIDRSLRPFLRFIEDQDITLTVMLLQSASRDNKNENQLIKMSMWAGSILIHYGGSKILNNLYSGRIFMDDYSYCTVSVNDDGIVMLEGAFNRSPMEKIQESMSNILEEQKIFKEIYKSIPQINLFKGNVTSCKSLKPLPYARLNGRKYNEIRPLNMVIKPLKANSVIFTRGETSVLGILSVSQGAQGDITDISVNYRFHPFSVGEGGETFGNSRREKGHGDFVKNSLWPFWKSGFFYKMIGEVLMAHGSTSANTLCATSMCLAEEFGEELVSCVTVGQMKKDILVDLSAEEDSICDCDLKVVSDKSGLIYGFFMDTKSTISIENFYKLVEEAKKANKKIIKYMASHIVGHRQLIPVKVSKLGSLVGKNGSNMKEMQRILDCHIKVFENGFVLLNCKDKKNFAVAKEIIDSFNKVEDGIVITAIVYAIKDINDDIINVNLGIFHFNIEKSLFKKYEVGHIITGTIAIGDKNITLKKIKRYSILKK